MIEIFAWRKINNSFSVLTVYIYVEEIIDIVQHENPVNNYEEIKILALKNNLIIDDILQMWTFF